MININSEKYLKDWAIEFLRHRDLMTQLIEDIKTEDIATLIKYKNNSIKYIYPDSDLKNINTILSKIKLIKDEKPSYILVTFNTKEAVNNMIKSWKQLSLIPQLQIYFLNPLSPIDKKWSLFPYTHERISDSNSLEMGINSMAENVGYMNEEQIKSITHSI